jgi:hypothetical protein
MTNNKRTPQEKAKELLNVFGETLALKVVDEIIKSSPSLPILGDAGLFGEDIELSNLWWKDVEQSIKTFGEQKL